MLTGCQGLKVATAKYSHRSTAWCNRAICDIPQHRLIYKSACFTLTRRHRKTMWHYITEVKRSTEKKKQQTQVKEAKAITLCGWEVENKQYLRVLWELMFALLGKHVVTMLPPEFKYLNYEINSQCLSILDLVLSIFTCSHTMPVKTRKWLSKCWMAGIPWNTAATVHIYRKVWWLFFLS